MLIKDSEKVKNKLKHFHSNGGLENLCILSDFDYTLTRYSLDGYNKLDSSFSCISNVIKLSFISILKLELICQRGIQTYKQCSLSEISSIWKSFEYPYSWENIEVTGMVGTRSWTYNEAKFISLAFLRYGRDIKPSF